MQPEKNVTDMWVAPGCAMPCRVGRLIEYDVHSNETPFSSFIQVVIIYWKNVMSIFMLCWVIQYINNSEYKLKKKLKVRKIKQLSNYAQFLLTFKKSPSYIKTLLKLSFSYTSTYFDFDLTSRGVVVA